MTTAAATPPTRLTTAVLILAPGIIWGSSFLFIAEALEVMEPQGVTFARTSIGAAVLALLPSARAPINHDDRWKAPLLGLIWIAIPMSMFPFAEQHVTSALAGLLNAAIPLFVALIGIVLTRTAPSRPTASAIAVGLTGATLIAAPNLAEGGTAAWGVLLILVALVCYGISLHLVGPLQQRNGAIPVVFRAVAFSALATAPTGWRAVVDAEWNLRAALAVAALGAGGTAIANVLAARAAGRLSPTQASAIGFVIPSVSLALGILVRGEHVGPLSIAGGMVCIIGALLLSRAPI